MHVYACGLGCVYVWVWLLEPLYRSSDDSSVVVAAMLTGEPSLSPSPCPFPRPPSPSGVHVDVVGVAVPGQVGLCCVYSVPSRSGSRGRCRGRLPVAMVSFVCGGVLLLVVCHPSTETSPSP